MVMGDTYPEDTEGMVLGSCEERTEREGVVGSGGEGKDAVEEAKRV
jgi:hypothetical protein